MADLASLTTTVLQRLRDPQADFELQVYIRGESETLWLTRRGARVRLSAVGTGGGELDWQESAYRNVDPPLAFDELADRVDLVVLYAGGPFPDELMAQFLPDETQPIARYKAEWPSWDAFTAWLRLR